MSWLQVGSVAIGKARAASVQSFALWQQATVHMPWSLYYCLLAQT